MALSRVRHSHRQSLITLAAEPCSNAGGGSGCSAAADVPVDITSVIQAHVQNADAPPAMAFEVRAPDELNKLQFKKFGKNPT